MGEAKRRKKLLGNEYGKPNPAKSGIESDRPPIPSLPHIKLRLNSVELRDWLIHEWQHNFDFAMFVSPEDARIMASALSQKLFYGFQENLDLGTSINYNLSPSIEIAVGINTINWTIWAVVSDRSKGTRYATSDDEEFSLA